jgi:EAL domain-containing protein (putative c-di-GMP-specific phosphodiesterase class I)/FixJ family two-component response regulator
MKTSDYKQSVLVVDDDEFILATIRVALMNMGYEFVLTAECAEIAIGYLSTAEPAVGLVLSDLNMPDVDGVELLRRFGEMGYSGNIVLFSGEDSRTLNMAVSLAKARKLSVLGAITKPFRAAALEQLLANHEPSLKAGPKAPIRQVSVDMLAAAIKTEELVPWYQPKIAVASQEVVGFEALVRWPRPEGMIFPDAFISVAEENGLIDPLTFLLIKQAVRMGRLWREHGMSTKVAVNISMDSLQNLAFPDLLDQVFKDEGGDTSQFKLEITESRLMADYVNVLDVLLRLRLKKIKLSIDDFGTGHSNLGQLRDLPFDELKLDRSYVQGASSDPKARVILESTVEMAQKLGMEVVAEGVETLEDWKRVEQLGCDQVQGYFVARPMPGEAIPAWVASWPERRASLFSDQT